MLEENCDNLHQIDMVDITFCSPESFSSSSHHIPRLHFPACLAVRYGHLTSFWPMECERYAQAQIFIKPAYAPCSFPFCLLNVNDDKTPWDKGATRWKDY